MFHFLSDQTHVASLTGQNRIKGNGKCVALYFQAVLDLMRKCFLSWSAL